MTQLNLKHILVPVDFSESSLNALDTAVAMAKRHKAALTMLHVTDELVPYYGNIDVLPITAPVIEIIKEGSNLRLETYASMLKKKHQIDIGTKTTQGFVASEICATAQNLDADIIVMGTHGVSGFREFFIGSYAYEVVKRAPCPVLTVPPNGKWEVFSKIMFPIRNTEDALEKYDFLRKIIRKNQAVLFVLGLSEDKVQSSTNWIETMLLRFKKTLNEDDITYLISQQAPAERTASFILETAEQEKIDLIAITATLDRDMNEFFIGPYAQQIVNHSKVPVLSIRSTPKLPVGALRMAAQQYLDLKQLATT